MNVNQDNIDKLSESKSKYREYIEEHRQNVSNAYKKVSKCPYLNLNPYQFIQLERNINMHDRSKYSEEEFEPYRMKFFPINDEEKKQAELLFDNAWIHHYRYNWHHWNYWREIGKEMPKEYIAEMACDHIAMSMKFGGDAIHWYSGEKEKGKINLSITEEEYYMNILNWYYNE